LKPEAFWRSHHTARRIELKQREYCEAHTATYFQAMLFTASQPVL
jgi:hypothetical protein